MNAVKTASLPSKIETVSVSDLLAYPLNSKEHPPEQIETLKYSLAKFGQTAPLVIDRDGVLIAGHGRLQAMKEMGITECAVMRVSEWTEEMAKEYRILDNRSNESPWNWEALKVDLSTFESPFLANLFPDLEVGPIDLESYKAPQGNEEDAEAFGEGDAPDNANAVFLTVECVNAADAENCRKVLRDAGYSLITSEA